MNKLRVVIDTNVFVSALLRRTSIPFRIYQHFLEGNAMMIISPNILDEIENVIHRDYIMKRARLTQDDIKHFMRELTDLCVVVKGNVKVNAVKEDPDDNKFLAAAVEGKAQYIVTGDKHLLKLKEYRGIKIIAPKEFIEIS